MDEIAYKKTIDLIEHNRSIAEFADFGDGVNPEWIAAAEKNIGTPLPESYKWWLTNYSGGEIGGEEIFSVYAETPDDIVGGDIVYMYKLAGKDGLDSNLIPLCHSDIDGVFVFQTENGIKGNEYPVLSLATGDKYADNFLEFVEKRIMLFT
jgi:hypothetical protein